MDNVYVIAEAGVNHNGSMDLALQLIDLASDAGANAVKFQSFNAAALVTPYASKANYQKNNTALDESSYDMLKKLELDEASHNVLHAHCKKKNIDFLSSPFDLSSIDLLNKIGMPVFKIASGEITNLPFLEKIGQLKRQVILSTGMADLGEIEEALNVLTTAGTAKENITVLHATTEYPAPFDEVNLRAMQTIAHAFKVNVGYSDHTRGIEIPIAAVAMGATVIEKHFTLDKNMSGPDHKASIEPNELKQMIVSIRHVEEAMGTGIKKATHSELANKPLVRKSIMASRPIRCGELFGPENLDIKRPGHGLSPMQWYKVLGKQARRDYEANECIEDMI